jgi:Kef-type K+ transport system membrane component KefB/Trk K+ transport system NAD-binding subunit
MPAVLFRDVFDEIVALLLAATVAGLLALRLRQPLIIGFIAVGILAGPSGLNWIRSVDQIHTMAEMGLALLLFIVGLKLDVHLIRTMGRVALATGLGQVIFTVVGGFLIALAFGMSVITSIYVAVALTFSSTIIIVKLLTDKRETDSLHGRIALGLLIVQDIVVILAMIGLSAFSRGESQQPLVEVALIIAKGVGLLTVTWIAATYVLPKVLPIISTSTELLVLFGIVWALALANFGAVAGFSKEIGAFLAGVSLASVPYKEAIGSKLVAVRDFLLLFFFIELGSRLDIGSIGSQVWSAIPLSVFVLIGNPIIVMIIMGVMGYRKRTSFLTGLTVAQVSEFSLILVAMGARLGYVGDDAVGIVTLVALITIALSTYMILYSHNLYGRLARYLGIFERKSRHREDSDDVAAGDVADTVIVGLGSYGTSIADQLRARGRRVLGVDFDPVAIRRWAASGMPAVYADMMDAEFPHALPLSQARWIISSVRDSRANTSLLASLERADYKGLVAASVYDELETEDLLSKGADLVFEPFQDAAVEAADLVFTKEAQIERKRMDKQIDQTDDHYIVCGYGRMGQQIVKDLQRAGLPLVVVESNPEQVPKLIERAIPHVIGKASEDKILMQAGIGRARGLVSVYPTDEDNVFIVLTARVLNPTLFIVARSILEENEDKLRRAGADKVMSPYTLGGRQMAAAVTRPQIMEFVDLVLHTQQFDTHVAHIVVSETSPHVGKSLVDSGLWQNCGVTVLAVRRGMDIQANPCPDYVIEAGDELICMGTQEKIDSARTFLAG